MESEELTRILVLYGPKIRAFFARRMSNRHDIEDLFGEVVLAAVEGIERFGNRSTVSTWIYAICRNVYSHHIYYSKRDRQLGEAVRSNQTTERESDAPGVKRLISRLPKPDQKLYRLYYVEGYSVLELSRMLKRPEGTVKYQLYQLRSRFRDLLG